MWTLTLGAVVDWWPGVGDQTARMARPGQLLLSQPTSLRKQPVRDPCDAPQMHMEPRR